MLTSGDYDGAINRAIEGLRTNKNAKSNQDYVYLLEESFVKAKERDEEAIQLLVKKIMLQIMSEFMICINSLWHVRIK